jgi:sec-independent protein translocase protein TatC
MGVDDTQPLISHLIELRKRLLNSIIAILVIFLALVYFANDIYQLVSAPLISKMPVGATMIATDVASPFFTPIKLTFMVSVILSVPIILYQVWALSRRRCISMSAGWWCLTGIQYAAVLYRHGFRLFCRVSAGVRLPDPCGAGRGAGLDRYSQLSRLRDGAVYGSGSLEVPVAIVLLCWMGVTTPEDCVKNGRMCWWAPSWWACC